MCQLLLLFGIQVTPFLPKICGSKKSNFVKVFLWLLVKEGIGRRGVEIVRPLLSEPVRHGHGGRGRGESKKWGDMSEFNLTSWVPVQKKEESPSTKITFLFITTFALQTFIYEGRSVRTLCIYHTFLLKGNCSCWSTIFLQNFEKRNAIPFEADPHPPWFYLLVIFHLPVAWSYFENRTSELHIMHRYA